MALDRINKSIANAKRYIKRYKDKNNLLQQKRWEVKLWYRTRMRDEYIKGRYDKIIYDKIKDLPNDRPAIYFSLEDMTPRPERDEYTYGLDFTQDIHPTFVQGKPNMVWYDMIMQDHLGFTPHSNSESTQNNWCRVWTRNQ